MLRRSKCVLNYGQYLHQLFKINLHTSTAQVLCSYRDRDLPVPHQPTPVSKLYNQDTDILLEQLRKSKTLERVLELTAMHLDVMNSKHVVTCLDSINEFTKDRKDPTITKQLLQDKTFQALCSHMMRVVRFLEPQETLTIYKTLAGLGIRPNTYAMQCILKMLGAHLNDMNLGQLTFLNFLLRKQRPNALADGLKLALPLVLQTQIDQQLDSDNMTEVVNCLSIACRSRLKPVTIEKIVSTIIEKCTVLTSDLAVPIVFSLLNLETPVDGYRELINAAFDVMTRNTDQISQKQITDIIRLCRNKHFYHSAFLFACAEKIVSEKWNLESTYEILNYFYRLNFSPQNLKDHFVNVIHSERETFKADINFSSLNCVEYLTATGYTPKNIADALEVLCSDENKIKKLSEISPNLKVKFLSCLSMLGYFPETLLLSILDEEYLSNAWSASKKQGRISDFEKSIFSLMWSIEIYDQTEKFNLPHSLVKNLTQSVYQKNLIMSSNYPLKKCIESGLGGSQFLLNGVFTHDGHCIDHVLAMRSGNYPVSLQTSNCNKGVKNSFQNFVFVEDIILPEDAKIVTVIVAHGEHYCRDPEVLKGWMDTKVKNLAKKKYSPVVIHFPTWRDLPDREKIPYLMQEIKLAVQDEDICRTTLG